MQGIYSTPRIVWTIFHDILYWDIWMSQYDCQQIIIWNLSDPTLGVISWTKCLSPLNYILSIFMDTHTLLSGIMDNFEGHDRTRYMTKAGLCCSYIILCFKCSIHTGCSFHAQLRWFPIGIYLLNKSVRYTLFLPPTLSFPE